jgi:hypothetical protein
MDAIIPLQIQSIAAFGRKVGNAGVAPSPKVQGVTQDFGNTDYGHQKLG